MRVESSRGPELMIAFTTTCRGFCSKIKYSILRHYDVTHVAGQQVDDFKSMLHNTHRHELLSVVTAVHHQRRGEALHNWTLRLAETLNLKSPCVRNTVTLHIVKYPPGIGQLNGAEISRISPSLRCNQLN